MTFMKTSLTLPESPPLFADYLYAFPKVKDFFRWDPEQNREECFTERLRHYQFREEISKILLSQNRQWNASEKVIRDIEKFRDPKTIAVVTGQQVGLFGGPLYTIYKIGTAVKLAEEFNERYPSWHFVPLFWMEVGDSDYEEINHIHLIDAGNQLLRLSLSGSAEDHRSIYQRSIPKEIKDLHQQLIPLYPANEFRDAILKKAADSYSPGKKFPAAFAEWIHFVLGENGIPLICPADKTLARLAQPLFRKALEDGPRLLSLFSTVNRQLSGANYHAQIQLNENQTLLFYEAEDGSRSRIDLAGGDFVIRSPQRDRQISASELFTLLSKHPERFTPNVALRPLMQDWLLPTGVYVAGPAEISYAAQLKPFI